MLHLRFTAQAVADLEVTARACGDSELADRLGAVLARLDTMVEAQAGQSRTGFDRDRILDTVTELAAAAANDPEARPAAAWLRGVLASAGREVDGTTVDLGSDPTGYAQELPPGTERFVAVKVHGDAPAPVAMALAFAQHAPEATLMAMSKVYRVGEDVACLVVSATGDVTDASVELDVAGVWTNVELAVVDGSSSTSVDEVLAQIAGGTTG